MNADDAMPLSRGRANLALAVLVIVMVLNFVDRQILSILAEDIKHDLQLTDADLGFLFGTAFAVFYAVFGIPLGRLADSWYRGRLIAIGLTLWSAMTALSGLSSSFVQLAVARIGVGIGEASASPAAYSMLADLFPPRRRALVLAIYSAGVFIGAGLSMFIGGGIAQAWNAAYPAGTAPFDLVGWQVAFLTVGIPGVLVAIIVAAMREPPRGFHEGGAPMVPPNAWGGFVRELFAIVPPFTLISVSRIPGALPRNLAALVSIIAAAYGLIAFTGDAAQWISCAIGVYGVFSWVQRLRHTDPATFKLIWGTPAVMLAYAGIVGLALVSYTYNFWLAPFAMRTMDIDKATAGIALGLPGAVAAAAGVLIGGYLSDAWKMRNPRGRLLLCLLSILLPAPLIAIMFTLNDFTLYAIISPAVAFLSSMWLGSSVAVIQDLVLPRMRGVAGATNSLMGTIGLAVGPYTAGKVATLSGSLALGVYSMFVFVPVAAIALWMAIRRIEIAEATREERAERATDRPGQKIADRSESRAGQAAGA